MLRKKVNDVELGKKYRDSVTGLVGVATAYSEHLDGSIAITLEPSVGSDNKLPDAVSVDKGNLEPLEAQKVPAAATRGGPRTIVSRNA